MEPEKKHGDIGNIKISEDVVATIASTAALEVEGVAGLAQNIVSELKGFIAKKTPGKSFTFKGVKVELSNGAVSVDLFLTFRYSSNIPEVAAQVQKTVKEAVENMTGLMVCQVNVSIQGIVIPDQPKS